MKRATDVGRRAALYLRVSTAEQTTKNQRPVLEQMARQRGYRVVATLSETASAAGERPQFARALELARTGAVDVIFVWSIDRLGRSLADNLAHILELDRRGVQLVSAQEGWLDTSGPARSLLISVFSWVAEQERARLIERTHAGLDRARREGKRLGRPRRMTAPDILRALELRAEGKTFSKIAMALKVPRATVARVISKSGGPLPPPKRRSRKA